MRPDCSSPKAAAHTSIRRGRCATRSAGHRDPPSTGEAFNRLSPPLRQPKNRGSPGCLHRESSAPGTEKAHIAADIRVIALMAATVRAS